jgi:Mn2+/Fe2+ NRAMP family transporter
MKKVTVALLATLALLVGDASGAYADPPGSNATVTGVQNFPSTPMDGHAPLVVLGVGLLASGVVLLRRRAVVPQP